MSSCLSQRMSYHNPEEPVCQERTDHFVRSNLTSSGGSGDGLIPVPGEPRRFFTCIGTMNLGVAASRESAAGNGFEDWRRSAEAPLRNVGSWKARRLRDRGRGRPRPFMNCPWANPPRLEIPCIYLNGCEGFNSKHDAAAPVLRPECKGTACPNDCSLVPTALRCDKSMPPAKVSCNDCGFGCFDCASHYCC
jgi:hypothetical protein